jgi:glucose/mannose-6-phosphate isomerase
MLDDINVLSQRDPSGALTIASLQYEQAKFAAEISNGDHDHRSINSVVVTGMGGSALAALLVKSWLKSELMVPIEVVRTYDLPAYVNQNTLVIASSYSGNTEETLSAFEQAKAKDAQIAIIASGGQLNQHADDNQITYVSLPTGLQPRMAVIYNLRALVALLVHFGIVSASKMDEIASKADWLQAETAKWASDMPTESNYAKQLALHAVGKTAVFYGGTLSAPVAYKCF